MVPAESPHRIENRGTAPGRVLDVAFGYLSDEDVVLFEEAAGSFWGSVEGAS
jgi:mannose-6-phosphate isomerase-like protein (cupin superfamily)